MSSYKGHLGGGVLAFVGLYYLLSCLHSTSSYAHPSFCKLVEWLTCTLLGALFPDIDIKSKGQKLFYWALFPLVVSLFICQRYTHLFVISSIALLPMMTRHRGLFHKLWFIMLITALFVILLTTWFPAYTKTILFDTLFFIVGVISHLWLDLGLRRMLRW